MDRLKGKVIIITGGASGMGAAMAQLFSGEGAMVCVADVNKQGADTVAAACVGDAIGVQADVAKRTEMQAMADETMARFGHIDAIVNNAGYTHRNCDLLNVDEDEFDLIFAVNAKAIYHATQILVPIMDAQGGGVIINNASTAGLRPRPGLTWYNASKGWAITATKSMAVELAPKKIRVNALCPVATDTPMLERFIGEDTPEKRAMFRNTIPLGRLADPMDIAHAALWLISDDAQFITGVALEVDGGRCV